MPAWALPWITSPYVISAALVLLVWLTYADGLKGDWLIDDQASIALYRGDWKDQDLNQPPEKWQRCKLSFHTIFRHIRYLYGRIPNPNLNWKRDKQLPFLPSQRLHHRFNLVLMSGVVVLLYAFLYALFGDPVAMLATALFIVHPFGCQTIVWMSGIGYILGFFCTLASLNVVLLTVPWMTTPIGTLGSLILFGLFQFLAIQAQFATVGTVAVLAFLGYWPQTIVCVLLGVSYCIPVIRDAIILREKTFHEQQMGSSTKLHVRKLNVALKSLFYYTRIVLWPKRMGLYHTFGYFYDLPQIESEDKYWFAGILTALGCGALLWWGSRPVQLGVVMFLAYLWIYLNWITINQFVTERYGWMPAAGVCLIVTCGCVAWHLLPVWYVLFGLALMRTWAHIPTFYNNLQFYESNIWNFPDSAVAVGNLGVTYMQEGSPLTAMEAWQRGTRMNPDYDVNWYNLSSVVRNYAITQTPQPLVQQVEFSRNFLMRALSARSCHFPEPWVRELASLNQALATATPAARVIPQGFSGMPLARLTKATSNVTTTT